MRCIVVKSHISKFPHPLRFRAGDRLQLGRRDDSHPGWVWVTDTAGNSGWAPELILTPLGEDTALASEDYDATELNTSLGEELIISRELAGWYWVRNQAGSGGWVPVETTSKTANQV